MVFAPSRVGRRRSSVLSPDAAAAQYRPSGNDTSIALEALRIRPRSPLRAGYNRATCGRGSAHGRIAMPEERPLLMATEADATLRLAKALDADFEPLPAASEPEAFEAWRSEAMRGVPRARIVIAPWLVAPSQAELMQVDSANWRRRFEQPYLLWNFALGAASRRVTDGG